MTQAATQQATDASKHNFSLSPLAARKLYETLKKRGTPEAALRVGVRGGGCSGFTYVLEFSDDPPRARDLVFTYPVERKPDDAEDPADVKVFCDKKSILYLNDSTLDWEKTLKYQGFKFVNPQVKSSCGCNESFAI
ncbi:MAG TPA: iron-sulfur cluster assembly accessory protein [Polyangiaceae bacterium]|jgi:iron-sulfur cluster assembly protein|nr:iron-sulfur cluster assembly accessory protein [Polyangiaceae bacterium]